MTETVELPITELNEQLSAIAAANAEWLDRELLTGRRLAFQWLRFRPVRELSDVLTVARTLRLRRAEEALADAVSLARGHRGGYSAPAEGWTALPYPVTREETVEVLAQASAAAKRLVMPGGAYGWRWHREIAIDEVSRTVTITLRADHPSIAELLEPVEVELVEPPAG